MAAKGLSWDHKTGKGTSLLIALAMILALLPMAAAPSVATDETPVEVIVRELTPITDTAENLVEALGGVVKANLDIIGGFTATVPASMVDSLAADPAVHSATLDAGLQLSSAGWTDGTGVDPNPQSYDGSVNKIASGVLNVSDFRNNGSTGEGIDVALIDSGVVPVNGLTYPGKVINGPDLSFESQSATFRHLDTFGHGTHMAGIIAGRDDGAAIVGNSQDFLGVAPNARIVSVKVAGHDGATDVSQVIAAIDWVVQHKNDNGMNIRVLNLSFGTDSTQSYLLDPLAYAVEQAWKAGIVVVVSAGNDGNSSALRNPASDPFVIAVGAAVKGSTRPKINQVMGFSNCGTSDRSVDVVVPGESIAGLAAPGSAAYLDNPQSVVGERYMLGSGTSQAAAFVSSSAAVILSQRPDLNPDQVKALLMDNASGKFKKGTDPLCTGAGLVHLGRVEGSMAESNDTGIPQTVQNHQWSTGLGLLEGSRGSDHIEMDGALLVGEEDIFGNVWDGTSWSTSSASGTSWSGGDWNGTSWSGTSWSGTSWSGTSWSGTSWSGTSWSGLSWSGTSWSNMAWNGTSWSGTSWSGTSWSGTSWSGLSWSSAGWGASDSGVRWD